MDLCDACNENPPFVVSMSLCRQCLKLKVDAGRAAREARWASQREKADEAKARRDWQRPLDNDR